MLCSRLVASKLKKRLVDNSLIAYTSPVEAASLSPFQSLLDEARLLLIIFRHRP